MAKKKESNLLFYILIAAAVVVVAFSVYSMLAKPDYYGSDYQKAMQAQNPTDICATPEGYTDEAWQQHMSHHPDIYKECLQK